MGKGTVSKKQRANGLTWIYRFQTTRALDGKTVENTKVVGLVKDIGSSEAAAWRGVGDWVSTITLTGLTDTGLPFVNWRSTSGNTN